MPSRVRKCVAGHEFTPENSIPKTLRTGKVVRMCRICEERRNLYPVQPAPVYITRTYQYETWYDTDGHMLVRVAPERFETTNLDTRYRAARRKIAEVLVREAGMDPVTAGRLASATEIESMRTFDYANPEWILATVHRTIMPVRSTEEEATG